MEKVREKVFLAADRNLEKTILVVEKDTLRIRAREIAAKEIRFYLLLRLLLLLLLQIGLILLHRVCKGLSLSKVILKHCSKLCVCFFRSLRSLHMHQWVQRVHSRTFMILHIQMVHLIACNLMRLIAAPTLLKVHRLMKLQENPFGLKVPNIMVPIMGKGVLGLVDINIVALVCLVKVAHMMADTIFPARIKAKLAV